MLLSCWCFAAVCKMMAMMVFGAYSIVVVVDDDAVVVVCCIADCKTGLLGV